MTKGDSRQPNAERERWRATTRAKALERQLTAILTHPELGPLARPVADSATPGAPARTPAVPAHGEDPALRQAWDRYNATEDPFQAFAELVSFAEERGAQRALGEVDTRETERTSQHRATQRNTLIAKTVNDTVAQEAPDVDLELFWSFGQQAAHETPAEITNTSERIIWQKDRMVALARAKQQAILTRATTAEDEANRMRATAAPVIPGGSSERPAGAPSPTPAAPRSFVDQTRDLRRRTVGAH